MKLGTVPALMASSVAAAAESAQEPAEPGAFVGLMFWDFLVIGAYFAVVLGVGWYYARGQSSSGDYFIAEKKKVHPILVGISLYATLMSTITYLGKPGEMINKGPMLVVGQFLIFPVAYFVIGYVIIPRLMRERVASAYELLELKLGGGVRLLGAGMFVGLRLIWMGLLIYLSSVALTVMFGLGMEWTPMVSLVTGLVAVIYTALGGLRTVIVTDAMQFTLLFLGAVMVVVMVTVKLQGFSWVPTEWSPHWDKQPWFSLDPHVRVSVFGTFISTGLWLIATAGSDQTAVQRYMATTDAAAARKSYLITSVASIGVSVVLGLLGLALLAFYERVPGAMGPGMTIAENADHLFPYFISHHLPVGLSGLVVSAAIAVAMSSVDSGVNSITVVTMRDFLPRLGWKPKSDRAEVMFSRGMAFLIGTVVVVASLFMQHVPGNFLAMTNRTANLVVMPLFMLFVFALWVPFATPVGALLGAAYGMAGAAVIAFWDSITGQEPISFQWIVVAAFVVNLVVGLAVSWWGPRRENIRGACQVGAAGLALLAMLLVWLVT